MPKKNNFFEENRSTLGTLRECNGPPLRHVASSSFLGLVWQLENKRIYLIGIQVLVLQC